eukprot:SAG31_NODE_47183_length_251_cov_0.960526_1_plen_37_part_01
MEAVRCFQFWHSIFTPFFSVGFGWFRLVSVGFGWFRL